MMLGIFIYVIALIGIVLVVQLIDSMANGDCPRCGGVGHVTDAKDLIAVPCKNCNKKSNRK